MLSAARIDWPAGIKASSEQLLFDDKRRKIRRRQFGSCPAQNRELALRLESQGTKWSPVQALSKVNARSIS